eukprot:733250-Hanusia_phi.AAC.1
MLGVALLDAGRGKVCLSHPPQQVHRGRLLPPGRAPAPAGRWAHRAALVPREQRGLRSDPARVAGALPDLLCAGVHHHLHPAGPC